MEDIPADAPKVGMRPLDEAETHRLVSQVLEKVNVKKRAHEIPPPRWRDAKLTEVAFVEERLSADGFARYTRVCNGLFEAMDQGLDCAIVGERGVGRSWLAAAAMNAQRRHTRFTTAAEISAHMRSAEGSVRNVIMGFRDPYLLVIDDADNFTGSKFDDAQLRDLLANRFAWRRPTIVVAEGHGRDCDVPAEVASRLSIDRIKGEGRVFLCKWNSLRHRGDRLPRSADDRPRM